jgi:hypothetical protein
VKYCHLLREPERRAAPKPVLSFVEGPGSTPSGGRSPYPATGGLQ